MHFSWSPPCCKLSPQDFTQHTALLSLHRHKEMETSRSLGAASSPLQPWAGRMHSHCRHLTPSAFAGSWRRPCSISCPTWSSCKTSHCDTSLFWRLYLHPSCPKLPLNPPAAHQGVSQDRNPSDSHGGCHQLYILCLYIMDFVTCFLVLI